MGIEQFNRDFTVTVDEVKIDARKAEEFKTSDSATTVTYVARPTLRVEFKIEKTIDPKPNKATISIWNLSKETRATIQTKRVPVLVEAGYVGNKAILFAGKLNVATHTRRGPDWVSKFDSGDGSFEYSSKRIRESIKPGAKVKAIMKKVADSFGLGLGNAFAKIDEGNFRGGIEEFKKGISLNGRAADVFDNLVASGGLQWSIQDENLLLLRNDETTEDDAIDLTPATGLLDSPQIGEKGVVTGRALLNPNIQPGRRVRIETAEVDGFYKITKATHTGDTGAIQPWFSEFEGRPL